MKRKKTLLILCIILLVCVVGIIIEHLVERHIDKVNTVDEVVFELDEDSLTSFEVNYDNSDFVFDKTDDGYTYEKDEDFPVDVDGLGEILSYFDEVHASFDIEDVEDYSQYGLDNPECTLTFVCGDETKFIEFGTFSTIDSKRYISAGDGHVYLIDDDLMQYISSDLDDYLDEASVADYDTIDSVKLTSDDEELDVIHDADADYTYTDAYEYYLKNGKEYKALGTSKVESFVSNVSALGTLDYVTYKATDDDLAKYGLDNPTFTISISGQVAADDDSDDTETVASTIYLAAVDDDNAYCYFDGSTIIYQVDMDTYNELADTSYFTLRPDEIVSVDWTKASTISATIDGENSQIAVEYKENDGNTYTIDGEEVEMVAVTSKIDGLTLTEAGDDYELGKEELSFAITLDDDDNTELSIVMYQYDGDNCVVTLNGETIGLVSRDSMSGLREAFTSAILNKGKTDDTASE